MKGQMSTKSFAYFPNLDNSALNQRITSIDVFVQQLKLLAVIERDSANTLCLAL